MGDGDEESMKEKKTIRCPNCHQKVDSGQKYCGYCGASLKKPRMSTKKWIVGILLSVIVLAGIEIYFIVGKSYLFTENELTVSELFHNKRNTAPEAGQKESSVAEVTQETEEFSTASVWEGMPESRETLAETQRSSAELYLDLEQKSFGYYAKKKKTDTDQKSEPKVSQQDKIQHIRDVYYDTQKKLKDYQKDKTQAGLEVYCDGSTLKKIVSKNGACSSSNYSLPKGYSAEFFYEDNALLFAFVYDGKKEYRFYLDPDNETRCIRYIGPDGKTRDFTDPVDPVEKLGKMGQFCEVGYKEPYWLGKK